MADKVFVVQYLDHEEGSMARWYDVKGANFSTEELAREEVRRYRKEDAEREDCLYSYRVAEKDSAKYFSQPTDRLEY